MSDISEPYQNTSIQFPEKEYKEIKQALLSVSHTFYSPASSPHKPHIPQREADSNKGQQDSKARSLELPTIASLSVHPSLETALHVLNADLTAAHFLLRHAQSSPQWEMMYLHGILHRIEGDVDNARAWYGDVVEGKADVFASVWGKDIFDASVSEAAGSGGGDGAKDRSKKQEWEGFLDRVQRWRDSVSKRDGSKAKVNVAPASMFGSGPGDEEKVDWEEEERQLRDLSLWELRKVVDFCEDKYGLQTWHDVSRSVWISSDQEDEKIKKIKQSMLVGGEGWREF